MDREGFKNRMTLYKEARAVQPQLSYWEWRQKYDAAPKPDAMPDQPQADVPTQQVESAEDRAHRWDNGYVQTNRQSLDSPYEDARYYDYRKPRFEFRKGDVHYGNPNLLKFMGRFGKLLRSGSLLGETIQNLFPSEEAELIEDLRVKMNKQNKWLTGQEDIPKYNEGGEVGDNKAIPTQEEYIAQQIAAKKAAALEKSLTRTMPRVPKIVTGERWNPVTKKVEPIYREGDSCAYTFSDNYGQNWMGCEDFRQNHEKYGWRQIPWESRQPGDAVLIIGDDNDARHTMMYDSDNVHGQPLFNHSNGGSDESAIRKKAKYPHHNPYLTYEFVGTPADSTQWINDYKKIYGFAEGGEVEDDPDTQMKEIYNDKNYFIKNWLSQRKDILAKNASKDRGFIDTFFTSDDEWGDKVLNAQLSNLANTKEYSLGGKFLPNVLTDQKFTKALKQSMYNKYSNVRSEFQKADDVPDDYLQYLAGVQYGAYYPQFDAILYSYDYNRPTIIHERTHALNPTAQKRAIINTCNPRFNIFKGFTPGIEWRKEGIDENNYLDSSDEIYSRLMEFRYQNKMDPKRKYTEQDIETMRNDKSTKDVNLLNRYTNEFLLKLFNDVAKMNSEDKRTHKSKQA